MTLALTVPNIAPELLAQFSYGLFIMEMLLFGCSLFMIMLILVQRGKGGGLTGALGGAGGQSAFGAKAGDAFTKITIGTAVIWIFLCMITIAYFNPPPASSAIVEPPTLSSGSDDEKADDAKSDDADGEDFLPAGSFAPTDGESTTTDEPVTTPPPAEGDSPSSDTSDTPSEDDKN